NAAFTSRRAMEEAINATFSERMVRIFTADAFGHIGQIHPRYRENEQGWLMINLRRDIWPVMQEIHLDTLEVISTRRSVVTTYVYASRENGERIQIEIALVYENGRWVLNSLAY
ncbi:MAG: hypothetical protein FWB93_06020, partial [Oscillospiraceae bacterium]|nr:hypothetical protein [Oscillospiraceae bacterium]